MIGDGDGRVPGRQVLESGFRVLRALPLSEARRQVASLAELTNLPRPTVYRLLAQLHATGAVDLHTNGRWEISPSLIGVTNRAEPATGLRTAAIKVMQSLREQTGAGVSLVVPTRTAFIALEMIPGREDLPIEARSGADMPDTTAAAMLLGSTHRDDGRLRPLSAAVDNEHILDGLTCYAQLITLPGGRTAALQIATSTRRPAERFAPLVHRAAAVLQARVAHSADKKC